ncbi:hypothetical protein VP01_2119g1 [Puccinia sorghi]|uniref:Uncharacterized protein n=1 Tax=Puccinia sorghi TaxID=27349 RepID=A0A0L6VA54_9BASI|nr:hypothetical protein VP01_2119g1 [Puccinia sorghi]
MENSIKITEYNLLSAPSECAPRLTHGSRFSSQVACCHQSTLMIGLRQAKFMFQRELAFQCQIFERTSPGGIKQNAPSATRFLTKQSCISSFCESKMPAQQSLQNQRLNIIEKFLSADDKQKKYPTSEIIRKYWHIHHTTYPHNNQLTLSLDWGEKKSGNSIYALMLLKGAKKKSFLMFLIWITSHILPIIVSWQSSFTQELSLHKRPRGMEWIWQVLGKLKAKTMSSGNSKRGKETVF